MFMVDEKYQIRQRIAQFFATQLITQEWVEPKDEEHRLFPASSDIKDDEGNLLVTAYAVQRPDGQWSLMLINKDYDRPREVQIVFHHLKGDAGFEGPVTMLTFGKGQYQWHSARKQGYAEPDGPPLRSSITGTRETRYTLPPASLNVIRGHISH